MAKKLERSPRGTLVHPWLTKPDTKFDKDNKGGHFKTGLRTRDGQALADKIDGLMAKSLEAARKELNEKIAEESNGEKKKKLQAQLKKLALADPPYSYDEETGEHKFSFKLPAKWANKKENTSGDNRVVLFDRTGKPLTGEPKIGTGTEAYVSFEFRDFYTPLVGAGVSLRIKAAQLLKIVEYGADASTYGFSSEDDEENDGESSGTTDDTETPEPEESEDAEGGTEADDL